MGANGRRATTTRDAVVASALRLMDAEGLKGVSIRAVARAVGAPPMSLYRHFASKEELLDLLSAALAEQLYADARHATWQEELTALTHQVRRTLLEHPRWVPLLCRPRKTGDRPRERLLAMMTDAGLPPDVALHGLSAAVMMGIGQALADVTLRSPDGTPSAPHRYERMKEWVETEGAADHPVTRSAVAHVPRFEPDENFAFAVQTLVAGLELRSSKGR